MITYGVPLKALKDVLSSPASLPRTRSGVAPSRGGVRTYAEQRRRKRVPGRL